MKEKGSSPKPKGKSALALTPSSVRILLTRTNFTLSSLYLHFPSAFPASYPMIWASLIPTLRRLSVASTAKMVRSSCLLAKVPDPGPTKCRGTRNIPPD